MVLRRQATSRRDRRHLSAFSAVNSDLNLSVAVAVRSTPLPYSRFSHASVPAEQLPVHVLSQRFVRRLYSNPAIFRNFVRSLAAGLRPESCNFRFASCQFHDEPVLRILTHSDIRSAELFFLEGARSSAGRNLAGKFARTILRFLTAGHLPRTCAIHCSLTASRRDMSEFFTPIKYSHRIWSVRVTVRLIFHSVFDLCRSQGAYFRLQCKSGPHKPRMFAVRAIQNRSVRHGCPGEGVSPLRMC